MGIITKLRIENENLERRIRGAKRIAETWRVETARQKALFEAEEIVLTALVNQAGGKVIIPQDKIQEAKEYKILGRLNEDGQTYELITFFTGDGEENGKEGTGEDPETGV